MTNTYEADTGQMFETMPERIISLVPSLTESLFDINLGERVVGVTDYCVRPAEKVASLPKVGGTKTPDIQRILALQPDLVFANQEENRAEDVQALIDAGIRVWVTFPQTVQDEFNLLWDIMDAFHETAMVPRVRLIEFQYDWASSVAQQYDDAGKVVKVFVPIWLDPLMTFNRETYSHDLLRVCGGTNAFADHETRYPRVTWEEVVAAQPDVILLPSEPFAFSEEHLPLFQALDVHAAKNGRIHRVDGSLLTWHGTRIAYALNEIPLLIHPVEDSTHDADK